MDTETSYDKNLTANTWKGGDMVRCIAAIAVAASVVGCASWRTKYQGPSSDGKAGSTSSAPKLERRIETTESDVKVAKIAPSTMIGRAQKQPVPYSFLPDNDIGRQLRNHFMTAAAFGIPAEERFMASLSELRSNAPQVVDALQTAYDKVDTKQYFTRWLIVDTLTELESPHAIASISRIARSEVPPEEFDPKNHGRSSVEKEVSIRLAAIRGLASLARRQHREAEDELSWLAKHGRNNAVRTMAVQGYMAADFDRRRSGGWAAYRRSREYAERLLVMKELLPKSDHGLLQIQPVRREDLEALSVDPESDESNAPPKLKGSPSFTKLKRQEGPEGKGVVP